MGYEILLFNFNNYNRYNVCNIIGKKYHEKLLNQRYIYSGLLEVANSCSYYLYNDILAIEKLDESYKMYTIPYGTEDRFAKINATKDKFKTNKSYILKINKQDFKSIIKDYINRLNEFKLFYNEKNIIGFSKHNSKYLLESISLLIKIKDIDFEDEQALTTLLDHYQALFWQLEYVVAELRRPWTSDLSNNKKINNIIFKGIVKE